LIYCLIVVLFVTLLAYASEMLRAVFLSPDSIREWVLHYGKLAPVVLFLLQIAQVLIAPLNNFIINAVGGYLFGPYLGFVLNYSGWIMGAIIVFWFSRLFGRGFVSFFVNKTTLKKYDSLLLKSQFLVFLLFLLPGPPDDFLVYVIGMSRSISFKNFLIMILIGKIPGKLATSYFGAGVAEHKLYGAFIYGAFVAVSLVVFALKPELWRMWKPKIKTEAKNS